MKLLLIHPGASFSTADVYNGYHDALVRAGHDIIPYLLDERLERANVGQRAVFRHFKRPGKPTNADIVFEACSQVVTWALYHKVDAVLFVSTMYAHPDFFVLLRRARIASVVIGTEHPYDDAQFARLLPYIDVAFVNERSSVAAFRGINTDTYYLPHAFAPEVHNPHIVDDEAIPAHDVVFVGTGFQERLDLLAGVDWTGIDLGLYGTYTLLPSRHRLRKHIKGGVVPNAVAAALYRKAKIGLNLYRTSQGFGTHAPRIQHAESLNPRAVELAACGAFHLSDWRAEAAETFAHAVPTFHDSASLEATLRTYLTSPYARQQKAAKLPACVRHLTFDAQAEYVVSTLRAAWSGASAAIGA